MRTKKRLLPVDARSALSTPKVSLNFAAKAEPQIKAVTNMLDIFFMWFSVFAR